MLMAVDITAGATIDSGTPRALFNTGIPNPSFDGDQYGVTADGQRFFLLKVLDAPAAAPVPPTPLTVILNWTTGLSTEN
jgi:hypothetical protein